MNMVSKIIALINDESKTEIIEKVCADLGQASQKEVVICYLITGPADWGILSRSVKDKHPNCKRDIAYAKEKMDAMLRDLRSAGIQASKRILMVEDALGQIALQADENDLIVVDSNEILKRIPQNNPRLLLKNDLQLKFLADVVLASSFEDELTENTSSFLQLIGDVADFHTHLLRVNTPEKFESSGLSIEKMKKAIQFTCLGKTHIHVHNAASCMTGLSEFVAMKNIDLVVLESHGIEIFYDHWKQDTPILFLP